MTLLRKMDFSGNPYLGVYGAANDRVVVLPSNVLAKQAREIGRVLDVEVRQGMLASSTLFGALVAVNSHGAVVTDLASDAEMRIFEGLGARRLRSKLNAVGNNILCNDHGALVHPEYSGDACRAIEETLGVPVRHGTVAGMYTVGSSAVANGKGALCHPHASEEEREILEKTLQVPVAVSTACYGTPQVGACLISNTHGAVVGMRTTAIELGRIEEGLGLF